jgi:hypothetical protein
MAHHTSQLVRLLWKSDQPVAKTFTSQNTKPTRDKYSCPLAGFEPTVPARDKPHILVIDTISFLQINKPVFFYVAFMLSYTELSVPP